MAIQKGHSKQTSIFRRHLSFLAVFPFLLGFPSRLWGQALVREALSSFPADTEQFAYSNLAELRALPNYPEIRRRLLSRHLRDFEDFVRSLGVDPEKDVNEVVLGWRGPTAGNAGYFGVADGRFDPERTRGTALGLQLPVREYQGQELYAFGSGADPADLFFTFLSPTSALFGRFTDVKALLDVRSGAQPALDSNSDVMNWEAELEGTAPQWGILTGKAIPNVVAPMLGQGAGNPAVDPAALLKSVQAVLYRIDWGGGFSVRLSILCLDAQSATAFSQLLAFWRATRQPTATNSSSDVDAFLRGLDVQVSGPRLELSGSGSLELIGSLTH